MQQGGNGGGQDAQGPQQDQRPVEAHDEAVVVPDAPQKAVGQAFGL